MIVLLLLFIPAVMIRRSENLAAQLRTGLKITLVVVIAGIVGLFLLRLFPAQIGRLVPKRFRGHYNHFQEGTLGSFRRVPLLTPLTVAVWACESLRFFFIVLALNLFGGSFLHILSAALFIALGEALLTVIPFTSGGIGLVEGGMLAMIALFPSERSMAAAPIHLYPPITLFTLLLSRFLRFNI